MRLKKNSNKYDMVSQAGLISANNPTSIASEQFRTIRTNIQFSMIDKKLKTISVTSSVPNSGKTIFSTNLATTFATEENRILIVDTDLKRPTIHKVFKTDNIQGLTSLITNKELQLKDLVKESFVDNLYYLTSGVLPPNPSDLLSSKRMDDIITEMKEHFDLIIFDTPPVLAVTDAQIIGSKVDGTVVIVPEGEVTKEEVKKTAELLKNVNAKVLGSVMNKVKNENDTYYYYGAE